MKARRHGQTRERHTGYTLIELVFVVAILGIATIAGIRGLEGYLDAIAVRNAVADVGALMARARDEAITRRTVVTLHIDTATSSVSLRVRGEPERLRPVGRLHGVTLATARDSIAFDVRGLGYGVANLTLVARRGAAADTLVVSRLGRVRY